MQSNLATAYPHVAHPHVERFALRSLEHLPRYLSSPLHTPTVEAFSRAEAWLDGLEGSPPLILDSGCGTGRSTHMLARAHPEAAVSGIDRSEARLEGPALPPPNALLVRAECASFWRMLLQRDVERADSGGLRASRVRHHFILYPNPYPKAARLNLRWHGHPVLPVLVGGLGGTLELRSNWRVYLDEFLGATQRLAGTADAGPAALPRWSEPGTVGGAAAQLCAAGLGDRSTAMREQDHGLLTELPPLRHEDDALTLFERKFDLQGERLYRLRLPNRRRGLTCE